VLQVVKIVRRSSDYPPSIVKIAVHNVLWMYPITLLPLSKQLRDNREGECRNGMLLFTVKSK
jgi:hypothetical protein